MVKIMTRTEIDKTWCRLLQEVELAKNYQMPYRLQPASHLIPNPILERLLPSALFIWLVSILDDALETLIDEIKLPRPQKDDLFHRIELLDSKKLLNNTKELHAARERRNDIAHDFRYATWAEFEEGLGKVETALQFNRMVGQRPKYDFYAEKSGGRPSDDPSVYLSFDHMYGLTRDGAKILEVKWTTNLLND